MISLEEAASQAVSVDVFEDIDSLCYYGVLRDTARFTTHACKITSWSQLVCQGIRYPQRALDSYGIVR